jgi:hypothetical protein
MEDRPTQQDLQNIHEQASIIEDIIKNYADGVKETFGTKIAVNVFVNAGVSTIALGLSLIKKDDIERLAAMIRTFMAIGDATKRELSENEAHEILKKIMEKK